MMSKLRQRRRAVAAKREAAGKELLRCAVCGHTGPVGEQHVERGRCVVTRVDLTGSWCGFDNGMGDVRGKWWRARGMRLVCGRCRAGVRTRADFQRVSG